MESLLLIHQLPIPKDSANIIVKLAITIIDCSQCGKPIQKDYKQTKGLGWYTEGTEDEKCLNCAPNLQQLYLNKK